MPHPPHAASSPENADHPERVGHESQNASNQSQISTLSSFKRHRLLVEPRGPFLRAMDAEVEVMRMAEPMAHNTTVENAPMALSMPIEVMSSPVAEGKKRKVEEQGQGRSNGKENGKVVKKSKGENGTTRPLVELKGRKLVFNQEPLNWTAPKRRLLNFEGFLLDAEEAGKTLTELPEEFYDLVVMAGHEMSYATDTAFAKNLRSSICKEQAETLSMDAVSALIPKLFQLQHYGYLPTDFPSSSSSVPKIPASLQIRRWEAINPEAYFSAEQCQTLKQRQAERVAARQECLRLLAAMDDVERWELVKGDGKDKGESKEEVPGLPASLTQSPSVLRRSRENTAGTANSRRSASPVKKGKLTPEEEEAARLRKEERDAKKAAIAEKKAAKEAEAAKREAEKAKLEAKKERQAQAFGSFFKPKIGTNAVAGPSKPQSPVKASDFQRTFRPFERRGNVSLAPVNRWAKRADDLEMISGNELEGWATGSPEVRDWMPRDFLSRHFEQHGLRSTSRPSLAPGIKSGSPYGTVGEVWAAHQDAADPRKVLKRLRNGHKFPWKILSFDQQNRPPYHGTFTKKSAVVGPRTPFAQDPLFDYSYDSADDWQEDEGGEDVDEPGEVAEVDDEDTEEEEGEFDDWLDDSEDVDFVAADDVSIPDVPKLDQGRLPMKVVKKTQEVKKIVKVTPWFKGPVWENRIGEKLDVVGDFRLQLLNDTPSSFDPFTYESHDQTQRYQPTYTSVSIAQFNNVKCLISSEPAAPIPIPTPLSQTAISDTDGVKLSANGPTEQKSAPRQPKIAFPASHLSELLHLIHGSTKNRLDLLSFLRERFEKVTSKIAIDAKMKEVAVRDGKAKDSPWRVKEEVWLAAGLAVPQ